MKITLIGIDPGVVDTALVVITLRDNKTWSVWSRVWTETSRMNKQEFVIKQSFLDQLRLDVKRNHTGTYKVLGVEGYRPRGKSMKLDMQMGAMVQRIHGELKGSAIVDNTGIKNVVKQGFLDLFNFGFPHGHHADRTSAARVALRLGIEDDRINAELSDFVRDHLLGEPWRRV